MTPEPSPHWLVPAWPAPAGVRAVFTTRGQAAHEGASALPYGRFNLGDHVGDAPQAVAANRAELRRRLGTRPVFMQQVHGLQVLQLQADTPDGLTADAAISTCASVACTVMVADCLPVLLTDIRGQGVAAVHAGWRGLAAGVLEHTVSALRALLARTQGQDTGSEALMAWLGPCIGPQAFEVGPEVRAVFEAHDGRASACFQAHRGDRHMADLPALARQRLQALGVHDIYGNDSSPGWCTVGHPARFHSYRRDQGRLGGSGRMAACIWRADPGVQSLAGVTGLGDTVA